MVTRAMLVVFMTIVATASALSQELAPRTFFDGQVTILIPVGFEPMSEEMLVAKYPGEQRPNFVFSNPDGSVNVALRLGYDRVLDEQVLGLHRAIEQFIRSQNTSAEWNRSETGQREYEPYFLLDVVSPGVDTGLRNMTIGMSLEDRLLMIMFNCTRELEAKWAPVGLQIIDSILVAER